MSTNQFDFTALEHALRQHLPEHLHGVVAPFLESLRQVDAAPGSDAQRIGAQPDVQPLLDAMAGRQVTAGGALISFGANSQMGEVTIGDLAGRDLIKVTVTVSMIEQAYDVRGPENPYLGLRSFTYADRDCFAGRERLVNAAQQWLVGTPGNEHTLLFVSGASGSGKSSLAQAGIIPALERHYQQRNLMTQRAVFTPRTYPLASVQDALQQLGLPAYELDLAELEDRPHALFTFIEQHTPHNHRNLIVLDQFEELFTLTATDSQRNALIAMLTSLPQLDQLRTHIIVTVRADYRDEIAAFQELHDLYLQVGQRIDVQAMDEQELRDAMHRPIQCVHRDAGKALEPALAQRLAREAAGDSAYLPLLQVTLEDLWRGGSLTLGAYGDTTIATAIQRRANTVLNYRDHDGARSQERPADQQQLLLDILTDLVKVPLDSEELDIRRVVRRRLPLDEVSKGSPERQFLIDELSRVRLLAKDTQRTTETEYVEVTIIHDALIREWSTLHVRIAEHVEDLRQIERFRVALQEWLNSGKEKQYLLTGGRLKEAEALQCDDATVLHNPHAKAFLTASIKKRQRNQTTKVFVSLLFVLLVIGIFGAGWVAMGQRQVANTEANQRATEVVVRQTAQANAQNEADQRATAQADAEAEAERASNRSDQYIAARQTAEAELELREAQVVAGMLDNEQISIETRLLLAVQSLTRSDNVEAGLHLRTLLDRYPWGFRVAQQPSGENRFDVGGSAVPDLRLLAFSPNDTHLVASYYNTLMLWDVRTTNIVGELDGEEGVFSSGAFTSDGRQLVTGERNGDIRIWNIDSMREERMLQGHNTEVQRLSVSNDDTRVLSISEDATARIQDLSGGSRIELQAMGEAPVFASFTRDDERVIVLDDETNGDGMVRLYDSRSAALLWRSTGAKRLHVDLSPDGNLLLAVQPAQIELFDTENGQLLRTIPAPDEGFATASFTDDGQQIITEGGSREWKRRWNVATGQSVSAARRHNPPYDPTRGHSPFEMGHAEIGSTTIATVNTTGEMRFWYPMPGQSWQQVPVADWARHIELLPDNQSLLIATDTGIQHWHVGEEQPVFTITEHISPVTHLVVSDDGQRALSASPDSVRVWNTATGEMLNVINVNENETPPASLSPDGTRFVVAEESTLRVIALADGQEHQIETTGFDMLIAFSNDSQHLLFYDPWRNRGPIKMTLAGDTVWEADMTDVDIEQIVVGGDEENGIIAANTVVGNAIHLLDLESGEHIGRLVGHTDWVTDMAFSEDGAILVSTGFDNTVRVWDVENLRSQSILGEDMSDPVTISNDGRLLAVQDTSETVDLMFTQHRDLMHVTMCRIGRVLTPDERISFGLESESPDLVNPAIFQPISADGCAPPDLPPAHITASASVSTPEQQVQDFLNTFSDALNDPDIANARRLQEWLDRLTPYIHPDQRERFRLEAGVAMTALVNLDIGAWINMPSSDIRLQMSFEVTETRLVEEEGNDATVEVVDGVMATTLVGDDVTEMDDHQMRMLAQRIPLSTVFTGEDTSNQTFHLERINGTWYLVEPFAE